MNMQTDGYDLSIIRSFYVLRGNKA